MVLTGCEVLLSECTVNALGHALALGFLVVVLVLMGMALIEVWRGK